MASAALDTQNAASREQKLRDNIITAVEMLCCAQGMQLQSVPNVIVI
jgi:hypothetical protein